MLEPRAGELIASRYQLDNEIAVGGMGAVWEATDSKLRRAVAIKLLVGGWSRSEDAKRRFEREAMVIAQLQCPHIVQIFDYGVERDLPFIVMELLHGEDLQKKLRREKRLALEEASVIVWATAKALGVAHGAGIVHRDLKPGNIFLVKQGDDQLVKVLDFGVARTRSSVERRRAIALLGKPVHRLDVDAGEGTRAGTIIGTPQYMSPEQATGTTQIDHRADLWSLGVISYRMLTGRLPFSKSKSAGELIAKVTSEPIEPPSRVAPDLPAEVDGFFARALARNPDERFPNAREMARAFMDLTALSMPSLVLPAPRAPLSSRSFVLEGPPSFDFGPSSEGESGEHPVPSGVRRASASAPPPVTPAPITPAPVTPAPITPAPFSVPEPGDVGPPSDTMKSPANAMTLSTSPLGVVAVSPPRRPVGVPLAVAGVVIAGAALVAFGLFGRSAATEPAPAASAAAVTTAAAVAATTATPVHDPVRDPAAPAAPSVEEPASASQEASAAPRAPVPGRPRVFATPRPSTPEPQPSAAPPPPPPPKVVDPLEERL